jgi:transcriptional regulator with XRE-family HTH domain
MLFNICQRRKDLGLTLEQVAKLTGVSKSTVKKWESGHIKNMRCDKIKKLAKALDVSPLCILDIAETSLSKSIVVKELDCKLLKKFKSFFSSVFNTSYSCDFAVIITENKIALLPHNTKGYEEITLHLKNQKAGQVEKTVVE